VDIDVNYTLDDLLYLMARLRDKETGCPWDIKQTYDTIAPSTLEEAYEVADAIERKNFVHLKEELGDLLFQVIFYSQLGKEDGNFTFPDIVNDLVKKLIRRHPHVFPDGTLQSVFNQDKSRTEQQEHEIKKQWEVLKRQEREQKGEHRLLDDVPVNLPALSRATKLQKRAASVGFDWQNIEGPIEKVREELEEVEQAIKEGDAAHIEEEIGDLLFAVVNVSRSLKLDAETLLRRANQKFERRFNFIEDNIEKPLPSASLLDMDRLWDKAKENGL
jgi:ATP diphosphatase